MPANDSSLIDNRGTATPLPFLDLALSTSGFLLDQFVADTVLPAYPVATQTGALPIMVADRHAYTLKRDSSGYPIRIPVKLNGVKYDATESSAESAVPDDSAKAYFDKAKAYIHRAQQTALSLLLARETTVAALVQNTGVFDSGVTAGIWTTDSNDPVQELITIIEDRATLLGVDPSALAVLMPARAWRAFKRNALVKAAVASLFQGQGATSINISAEQAAAVLGVGKVTVARAQVDTANPAKASVFGPVWDRTKVVVYLPSEGSFESLGLGKTFTWTPGLDGSDLSQAVGQETNAALAFRSEIYRDERATSDIVRVRDYIAPVVTNTQAAYIITGVVASNY